MFQLPDDLPAYTTDLPSGDRLGNNSAPGSLVICAKSVSTASCCSFGVVARRATNVISTPAKKAASRKGLQASLGRKYVFAGIATWAEIDWPEIASNAKVRSQADWNRSSGAFSMQWRTILSIAGGTSTPAAANSGGSESNTSSSVSTADSPPKAR